MGSGTQGTFTRAPGAAKPHWPGGRQFNGNLRTRTARRMPGMRSQAVLPPPAPDALAASQALASRIADRIRSRGGWIGLDDYMAMALYEPQFGYYAGGSRKFGGAGDFVTAPELCALFGACLAQQCAQWFEVCAHRVVEFGAGTGALAVQVLGELDRLGYSDTEYLIVELSGELAQRQRERIARELPQALARVRWLSEWPQSIDGVVLANELLDAMPVRAFAAAPGEDGQGVRVMERGVALRGSGQARAQASERASGLEGGHAGDQTSGQVDAPAFEWALREASPEFARLVIDRLAQGFAGASGEGGPYLGEIGEQAEQWVAQAAQRLVRGAMLLIDYGFPRSEYFHPQRSMGTLMCHYRHHAHGDPFLWPGLQDITTHVDFSGVAQAALAAGLQPLGFVSQARLLTSLGLLDRLAPLAHDAAGKAGAATRSTSGEPADAAEAAAQQLAWARQTQSVQVLLSEAEMGELFKAVAFGRSVGTAALGFARGDRMAALLAS